MANYCAPDAAFECQGADIPMESFPGFFKEHFLTSSAKKCLPRLNQFIVKASCFIPQWSVYRIFRKPIEYECHRCDSRPTLHASHISMTVRTFPQHSKIELKEKKIQLPPLLRASKKESLAPQKASVKNTCKISFLPLLSARLKTKDLRHMIGFVSFFHAGTLMLFLLLSRSREEIK